MLWILLTIWAAFAQTLRNAAQRGLVAELGTLGATWVRFLYGLPFALLWLGGVTLVQGVSLPAPNWIFFFWVLEGAVLQIVATALTLRVMEERNFTLGVAYSKTELIQVAVFGLIFLGDPLSMGTVVAIALATAGVLLLSPAPKEEKGRWRALLTGWTSRTALLGLASGSCFAISAVGYRGAALTLATDSYTAAGYTLAAAQGLQTVILGVWLALRNMKTVIGVLRAWRASIFAGFMGAAASVGWFTAFSIEPVAHVRTLGLVELFFSYAISRRFLRESFRRQELAGMALLLLGLVVVMLWR